ncbi:hypothetical protein [Dongshaea marina]|uniref:hypothetical protein n=1 Tax=Dongshaea marina TaxID=2047966 RepID=UPI000D3E1FA1|nr:hypothetical protein [Dongshaea marina]
MTLVKKLILLILMIALLAMLVGYVVSLQAAMAGVVIILLVLFLVLIAFWGVKSIRDEVANRYYWYEQLLDSLPTPYR